MNKLGIATLIVLTLAIVYQQHRINFIDARLYSFESYFFAPYDTDFFASKLSLDHMSRGAKSRVKYFKEYKSNR